MGAALVLTNGTPTPRRIDFTTLESDGFRLLSSPGTPLVLAAGDSTSVFLTVAVDGCGGVGRLTNWAEGVSLEVTTIGNRIDPDAADNPPDQYSLRDVILAPLGAAGQRVLRLRAFAPYAGSLPARTASATSVPSAAPTMTASAQNRIHAATPSGVPERYAAAAPTY